MLWSTKEFQSDVIAPTSLTRLGFNDMFVVHLIQLDFC